MVNLLLAVIYLAFISLGLPDGLLGAAWPAMYQQFEVPVSLAGGISMVISAGTIVSALLSDRMTLRFGAGKVTVASVAMTAVALLGFSFAPNYWTLIVLAIPYGLGAGGVDAALNNYVAVHYASRHMSWLHAMWGIGASIGPYIMSYVLGSGHGWNWGYRCVAIIQMVLTAVLLISLPLWSGRSGDKSQSQSDVAEKVAEKKAAGDTKTQDVAGNSAPTRKPMRLREVLAIPGAKEIMIMFFCYCAVEQTTMLWASSYMVLGRGIDSATASRWASLFLIGITIGRILSGFLTIKFDDPMMIRIGQVLVFFGIVAMLLPLSGSTNIIVGLMLVGLGCAPIYPCVIHSTPMYFGEDKSQAIVGVQMAFAYIGTLVMPPLFGVIANDVDIRLFPWYLLVILVLMVVIHERLRKVRG